MDDREFCELQEEIVAVYWKLRSLQKKYRKETGREFVMRQGCGQKPKGKKRCQET